jgi:hypothetical protein
MRSPALKERSPSAYGYQQKRTERVDQAKLTCASKSNTAVQYFLLLKLGFGLRGGGGGGAFFVIEAEDCVVVYGGGAATTLAGGT